MSSPAPSFNFKQIAQYIHSLQTQINQLRSFGKKMTKTYSSSGQQIKKILDLRSEISHRTSDPALKKDLTHVDFLVLEREHAEANVLWIRNYLEGWVERAKEGITGIMEKAKLLQTKRLKKTLTTPDIEGFKTELLKASKEHSENVKEIMKNLNNWNARNCCGLLETLTNTMKQMKTAERKREAGEGRGKTSEKTGEDIRSKTSEKQMKKK